MAEELRMSITCRKQAQAWRDGATINDELSTTFRGKVIDFITSMDDDGDYFHMRIHFVDGTAADIHPWNDGSFDLDMVQR